MVISEAATEINSVEQQGRSLLCVLQHISSEEFSVCLAIAVQITVTADSLNPHTQWFSMHTHM